MGFNSGFKGLMDLASLAASQAAVYANGLTSHAAIFTKYMGHPTINKLSSLNVHMIIV
jgi:phosphohistidine swiveling domain-containing protein